MLRPTDFEKLKGNKSRYAVVMGVAKRAREIAEQAEENGTILIEKPVSLAVKDLTEGDYKIMMGEADETADADEA
ncbi:MAG: DNA-directed RNA polymerase subunit omega [Clostridia bacterium]|nr:DNA-directed RNA polymerase subunit omega [Clostridia bacterium]